MYEKEWQRWRKHITGIKFEGKKDLAMFLNNTKGYSVDDGIVYYNKRKVPD